MPSELQKRREGPDTTTSSSSSSNLWPKKRNGMLNQDATLAKAVQNMVNKKKNVTGSKLNEASKKTCICAPTTHAGSFKCRLHQAAATPQKYASKLIEEENDGSKGSGNKSFDNATHTISTISTQQRSHYQQLSRFGRPTSAKHHQHLCECDLNNSNTNNNTSTNTNTTTTTTIHISQQIMNS